MTIPHELVSAVKARKAILFAGAGLSSSLGLPLFNALKRHLSSQLGFNDADGFDFQTLAEFYLLQHPQASSLFEWMRKTWHPDHVDITSSKAHSAIVDLDFPIIYTTNYDSWLECAFRAKGKPFRKVVNVCDLAEAKADETIVIKFHGDFDDPGSIVLTESNFLERMSLDQPLDIRLRSDSLANPLVFVGYSVSDPNIRYILFKLQQLWAQYSEGKSRPKSYVLMVERNPVQERLLVQRGVEPIVADEGDATKSLTHFFESLAKAVKEP